MNKQLVLIRHCREARRHAAAQRLAAAQRAAASAHDRAEQRSSEQRQACDDVLLLRSDRGTALDARRRASIMPSAQAMLDVADQAVQQAGLDADAARQAAEQARQALVCCERSLLRNGELLGALEAQRLARLRLGEQLLDDEVAITFRRSAGAGGLWS